MNNIFYNFNLEWRYEGLDYAIRTHSSWKQIDSEKFHELRKKYIEIARQIEDLTGYESEVEEWKKNNL